MFAFTLLQTVNPGEWGLSNMGKTSSSIWSARNTYLYLVCLITLIMIIVATVSLAGSVAELLYPEPEPRGYAVKPPVPVEGGLEIDEEEIARQQEIQRQWSLRRFVLDLVRNAAMLLLAVPIYAYHWRRIQRSTDVVGTPDASE